MPVIKGRPHLDTASCFRRSEARAHMNLACGLRATARAGRLRSLRSLNQVAVMPPTIETADQLLYAEPELEHVQRPFFRAVTADPNAVRNDQSAFVEGGRRRRIHRSIRDIDGAGNMASPVRLWVRVSTTRILSPRPRASFRSHGSISYSSFAL